MLGGVLIETMTFRLKDGADVAAFLEADKAVQTDFIPNHSGFIRRTTAQGIGGQQGEWIVVTLWYMPENADASADKGANDPVVAAFDPLINESSVRVERYVDIGG